jgi:hypothetical protein
MANNTKECAEAYYNPKCPYVAQINVNTNCMKNVEKALGALLGEDGTGLNHGIIRVILDKLDSLENSRNVSSSWLSFIKPVVVSVAITAVTTYLLAKFI